MLATKQFKLITVCAVVLSAIALQSFSFFKTDDPEKPKNLKVLPKDITHEELIKTMKVFTASLGVRCNECHVSKEVPGQDHPDWDFASDAKPEKNTAREMMKMVTAINQKYLRKIGDGHLDQIDCVTCHMGKLNPTVSVDSLPKKEKH